MHQLALGVIRDAEYDFIKQAVVKYGLRLTRNKENRTPLSILRGYSLKAPALRGQPNFKKKLLDYFENLIAEDETYLDCDINQDIHEAALQGNIQRAKELLAAVSED